MNTTLLILCRLSCFLSLLCLFIILLKNKFHIYYKILVLLCLFSMIIVIGSWTFFQGVIPLLNYAHLWVIGFPFEFLAGSLFYIYVRSVLKKTKTFSKWDLLHFAPALLHFIELIPFYLLPVKQKQASLTLYLLNPKTLSEQAVFIFPMNVHLFLKTSLWAFYIMLTIILLIKNHKKKPVWIKRNNNIWFWITRLTGIQVLTLIIALIGFAFFDKNTHREFSIIPAVAFILTTVILLLFKPKILYGLNFVSTNSIKINKNEDVFSKNFELSPLKIKEYKEEVELLFNNKKVFLIKNYTIREMSKDLNIPVHHLSIVINKEYGTNYSSFINKYRIEYIIQHRYDAEWSPFSLDGIGAEAGFNSRNTFFKAFKIVTGETPSEYFRKNENSNSISQKETLQSNNSKFLLAILIFISTKLAKFPETLMF